MLRPRCAGAEHAPPYHPGGAGIPCGTPGGRACNPPKGSSSAPTDPAGSDGGRRICNGYGCASRGWWRNHHDPAAHTRAPVTRPRPCRVTPRGTFCKPDTSGGDGFWNGLWNGIKKGGHWGWQGLNYAATGVGWVDCTVDDVLNDVPGESFAADTLVLLASGSAIPIARLKPGDKVLATNVKTGKTQAGTVSAVLVHRDYDLYDLTVRAGPRASVIHTTASHPFWDSTTHRWVKAAALHPGDHLRTPDGSIATVTGGYTPKQATGWMWDLTIPGDHDFYIDTVAAPVLVHNCTEGDSGEGIHSTLRGAEKNINSSEVMRNAQDVYYDENGNQVYVWRQGNGMSEITIRDPANGRIVTNQRSNDGWVRRQVTKGRWYKLDG
jgi:hypothetical protein